MTIKRKGTQKVTPPTPATPRKFWRNLRGRRGATNTDAEEDGKQVIRKSADHHHASPLLPDKTFVTAQCIFQVLSLAKSAPYPHAMSAALAGCIAGLGMSKYS